jgi:hypothetical protein
MKKMQSFLLVVAVAVVLSGCAATDQRLKGNFNQAYLDVPEKHMKDYANKDISKIVLGDLLIEPFDSTGVKETPALLRGEFSCYQVSFPEELKDERYIPERIKWYALVLSQGFEYLGQLVLTFNGETELLVDGTAKALKNAKLIVLSTMAEKVYGLEVDAKGIDVDRESLMADVAYRKDLIEKYGSILSEFASANSLVGEIGKWNRFDSPRGYILTPLDEKRFREIVSINPGYSYSQRLVNQPWVISTNPVQMVLQNVIVNHINAAAGLPNKDWRSKNSKNDTGGKDESD